MTQSAKREVLEVLRKKPLEIDMDVEDVRRKLMAAVENITEEDEKCAGPDYRAMCAELEKKLAGTAEELKKAAMELACAEEVIRNLRGDNQRLAGFREAVLRIFPEGDYWYGRR